MAITRWSDFTPAEQAKVSNGCGGKGCFKPPLANEFERFCASHDFRYYRGGLPVFKLWADIVFFGQLLFFSLSSWRVVYRLPMAVVYFLAVDSLVGIIFFKWSLWPRTKSQIMELVNG